jgi:LAO/AO transport system kinase
MADAIVINKADGDNVKAAKLAKVEFNRALHLYPQKESEWSPKVSLCSALKQEGISEVWDMITTYETETKNNTYFEINRDNQNKFWLLQTIEERLKSNFYNSDKIKSELQTQIELVEAGKTTPFVAAEYLLKI